MSAKGRLLRHRVAAAGSPSAGDRCPALLEGVKAAVVEARAVIRAPEAALPTRASAQGQRSGQEYDGAHLHD